VTPSCERPEFDEGGSVGGCDARDAGKATKGQLSRESSDGRLIADRVKTALRRFLNLPNRSGHCVVAKDFIFKNVSGDVQVFYGQASNVDVGVRTG